MTRPTWTMYHPNGKGTGSALRLELHPAHDQTDGSIFAAIAPQKTSEAEPYPSMDWGKAIPVKFDIIELSQILQVLRGCTESIADGKGLFHRTIKGNTVVRFVHFIEPVCGYKLDTQTVAGRKRLRQHLEVLGVIEVEPRLLLDHCYDGKG